MIRAATVQGRQCSVCGVKPRGAGGRLTRCLACLKADVDRSTTPSGAGSRNINGPTNLHGDKLKDHESMGQPFLAEMRLDPAMNQFHITRMGFDILRDEEDA